MIPRNQRCERARESSSLRLDGALSELEQAALAAHLARCEACRTYDAEIAAATAAIRETPLQLPARPIVLPRARRLSMREFQASAAAVAVASVALAAVFGALQSRATVSGTPGAKLQLANANEEARELFRSTLRAGAGAGQAAGGVIAI